MPKGNVRVFAQEIASAAARAVGRPGAAPLGENHYWLALADSDFIGREALARIAATSSR